MPAFHDGGHNICGFSTHQESPLTGVGFQRWKRPCYGELVKCLSTLGCSQCTPFDLCMSCPPVLWVMLHFHRLCRYAQGGLREELCSKYQGKKPWYIIYWYHRKQKPPHQKMHLKPKQVNVWRAMKTVKSALKMYHDSLQKYNGNFTFFLHKRCWYWNQ